MLESQAQQTSEAQLAVLLGELLDDGARDTGGSVAGELAPEVVELRDMARLLRASSLSVPLPEGRHAVRRALLATAEKNYFEGIPARAAWRRTGRWLGMAAMMVLIVGAFGLGAGLLDSFGSPSSPLYGLRLAVDRVRTALVPGLTPGTGSPAARARTAEIQELATSGYAPAAVTGYPLTYRFPAHTTIPSVPGEMATLEGSIGGLPATLVLRTSAGCPQGQSCGVFMAWVTPLEGTRASAEFGQMSGTFACAAGECKLTLVSKTGVFGKLTASVLTVNGKTAATGLLGTAFTSLGDWVATVEQAAAALKAEGVLPAGVSVADLVSDAASNQRDRDPKRSPQGTSGGSSSSDANAGSSGSASVGPIIVSPITRGSTDAGGGLRASGGISVTGSGVSVGGTISGSGSTSSGSASGAVSGSTSPNSGSASGSTSASGTASGSISIDSGAIGVASAIGATLGSTSTSGRVNGSGNANGGGVNVGGSVGVSGAPSSGGGLGGGLGGLGGGLGGIGGGLGGILH